VSARLATLSQHLSTAPRVSIPYGRVLAACALGDTGKPSQST